MVEVIPEPKVTPEPIPEPEIEPTPIQAETENPVDNPDASQPEIQENREEPKAVEPAIEAPQPEASQTTVKEKPMSNPEVIEATATPAEGAIQLHEQTSLSIWNRPVMPSDIEVVGTIQSAGIRPIEASHLAVFGTILNGRPILSSSLRVAEMLPGGRPIFFSDFQGVEGAELPGGRPIMASEAGLLAASTLPGGRPIFSNAIDNPITLMGFLD
jgi:hypothetical protein